MIAGTDIFRYQKIDTVIGMRLFGRYSLRHAHLHRSRFLERDMPGSATGRWVRSREYRRY
jgi:hypothetical protein